MDLRRIFLPLALLAGAALTAPAQHKTDSVTVRPWKRDVAADLSTTSTRTVSFTELDRYPTVDIRNSLTGAFTGLEIRELSGTAMHVALGETDYLHLGSTGFAASNRGFSNGIICVVDDIPLPLNQLMLDPEEIESVTLMNDMVDKAMLGPLASAGVLYIRTRSGRYNTAPRIRVGLETGVGFTDRWPEWVTGQDYVRLNNMARDNAGYTRLYDDYTAYSAHDPFSMEHPDVDYKSLMFRNWRPVDKVHMLVTGGSNAIHYTFGLSGLYEGGIFKVGPAQDFSKLNVFSKVGARVGPWIETGVTFLGTISIYRSGNISFSNYRSVPGAAFPLSIGSYGGGADVEVDDGERLYAVTRNFDTNYYAALVDGGFRQQRNRNGIIMANVDVDLGFLVKGLKSCTVASLDNFHAIRVYKNNDYLAWYWDPKDGGITELSSHKGVKATGRSVGATASYQGLSMYERLSYDFTSPLHTAGLSGTFYLQDNRTYSDAYFERQANLLLSGRYAYAGRYIVDLVADYAGTSKLAPGHRYAWFPSAGLAWVASEEPFLRGIAGLDLLKFRAGYGILGASNIYGTNFLYDSLYDLSSGMTYGPATNDRWFGENRQSSAMTTISRLANFGLDWERLHQADVGADVRLVGGLEFSAHLFRIRRAGIITEMTSDIPRAYGMNNISVYGNYNQTTTRGWEVTARFSRDFGRWGFSAGAGATSYRTRRDKVANDLWLYDWERASGTDANDIWGYVYEGKFTDYDDWLSSPKYNESVQMGDLKYADLDGDGEITSTDVKVIGNSNPKLRYMLNFDVRYGRWNLYVAGTGRAWFDIACTNSWFQNGWGDGNYSAFVRDNIGGDYPRLSYVQAAGNFVTSRFWLRKGDFFKIQDVEVGYDVPLPAKWAVQGTRAFVRGANLATFSYLKDVDPENTNAGIGTEPLYRTFTVGVELKF